ncbi:MAG: TIGR00341 family protein [Saprospiraceae bacterium]
MENDQSNNSKLTRGLQYLKEFILEVIHLDDGVDKLATINEIKNKKSMSGANSWMLMCSIVIASIGLDLNSPAVIIGAMLISPLMSPILGIGLSIGINDRETLKTSLQHFGIAIAIALITSFLYFYLSPLSIITPQISARTEPTFLDIIIAFFGGIAGIVSIARKDISTTLPGVAIATALMPPLCVTGFGLANGNWQTASNSFYLFFLNTFFVSLATYLIIRFLKFPYKDYVNIKEKRRTRFYIGLFSFIIIIPSIFIFKKVINKVSTDIKIEKFLNTYIGDNRTFLDDYAFHSGIDSNLLVMKVYGDSINSKKLNFYYNGLKAIDLPNTKIQIIPTSEITMDHFSMLSNRIDGIKKVEDHLQLVQQEKLENDLIVVKLKKKLNSFQLDSTDLKLITSELKTIEPNISSIFYAKGQRYDYKKLKVNQSIVIVTWVKKVRNQKELQQKLSAFLKLRLRNDSLIVFNDFKN